MWDVLRDVQPGIKTKEHTALGRMLTRMQYTKQPQTNNLGDTEAHRMPVLLLFTGCPFNHPTVTDPFTFATAD
jgi:hypothetical protein